MDKKYSPTLYNTMPAVLHKGKGLYVWDVEGNKYMDFLAGVAAINQGHSHPKIIEAMVKQANLISHSSRGFYNDVLPSYCEFICNLLGYEMFMPMSSGTEACETAIKLARKWAYEIKKVPANQATVLLPKKCFWGRSITAATSCDDPLRFTNFGPATPGFTLIDFNDLDAWKSVLESNPNICAYMAEPI